MCTIIFYLWIWSSSDFEFNVRQSFPSVNNQMLTCFYVAFSLTQYVNREVTFRALKWSKSYSFSEESAW